MKATGFFHVEKKDERWLLVDPAGNAFFHLGLCSRESERRLHLVKGRESAYEWLPPREGEFASASKKDSGGTVVSFHLANLIRKYGEPYTARRYAARMIERMRKWGFNSIGAFSSGGEQARQAAKFPECRHPAARPVEGHPAPPRHRARPSILSMKRRVRRSRRTSPKSLPARANDPLHHRLLHRQRADLRKHPAHRAGLERQRHACKRRFVQGLEQKYKTIAAFNAAWSQGESLRRAERHGCAGRDCRREGDVREFAGLFLEEYFRLVSETFRRHDPIICSSAAGFSPARSTTSGSAASWASTSM